MKFTIALVLAAFAINATAETSIYKCESTKAEKMDLSFEHDANIPFYRWEISGNDGTNSFDCYYSRQTKRGNMVFSCAAAQGAPYGYLTVYRGLLESMTARFTYIDENDFKFTGNFVGTCTKQK